MKLLQLVSCLLSGVCVQSLEQVYGYQGNSLTLHTGVEPSWTLEKIEWWIFSNNTWIATRRKNRTNTEWQPRFRGRLRLNVSTGDLLISNLSSHDALEYIVYIRNKKMEDAVKKIRVTVRQPLQTPSLQTVTDTSVGGRCLLVMLCSSLNDDVELSWDSDPPAHTLMSSDGPGVSTFLLMFTNSSVRVNCSSSRRMESIKKTRTLLVTPTCASLPSPQPPAPGTPSIRDRGPFFFLGGLVIGAIVAAVVLGCRNRCRNSSCSNLSPY